MSFQSTVKLAKAQVKNAAFCVPVAGLRCTAPDLSDMAVLKRSIDKASDYVMSQLSDDRAGFCFTKSNESPDLYSTCYAISFLGLVGCLDALGAETKSKIGNYLLATQHEDGLFRDPSYQSKLAEEGQGWGWQHLLPHTLIALDYLGLKPKHQFNFATAKFANNSVRAWLEATFATDHLMASNHYMNTSIALQYARDFLENERASDLITSINEETHAWLLERIMSGRERPSRLQRSRIVKTIYHILPSLLHDTTISHRKARNISRLAVETQNIVGGFGTSLVSDACEDIDSIYCVSVLADCNASQAAKTKRSFLKYAGMNQNSDGGFVFRRFLPFYYGDSPVLVSKRNVSNMFATWFRILSLAFATRGNEDAALCWNFSAVSGYQYQFVAPVFADGNEQTSSNEQLIRTNSDR